MSEPDAYPVTDAREQAPPVRQQTATAVEPEAVRPGALSPGLVRLMAVTCAVTVANLYYAQPLLPAIGRSLHVSQGSAALLLTVPAGDIIRRRPLLTGLLAFCATTLAGAAFAPNLTVLAAAVALCCVT